MASKPDYEKMSVLEQVQQGLRESLAHARGQLNLRTSVLPKPAPALSKTRVIAIRKKAGMSQAVFAGYLNVPKKTLQSWEQGARQPKSGEARLLQIFDARPAQIEHIIQSSGTPVTVRPKNSRRRSSKMVSAMRAKSKPGRSGRTMSRDSTSRRSSAR